MRTLFVVSGGDASGINAALYHGALLAARAGGETLGVQGGFAGLLQEQIVQFGPRDMMHWVPMPGSYFQSSREPVLAQPDAQEKLRQILTRQRIDSLILFGGDGTLRHIPPLLERWGVTCIGLPTTIDNDVPGTELTLGFDSACNFAHQVVDGMRATGHALTGRIFTLETLGGSTGFLALEVARGAGADAVLLPEFEYDAAQTATRLLDAVQLQGQALLVYSEGVPRKNELLEFIPKQTGIRVRDSRLGHAQRGGVPSHRDRALAADMSVLAFKAIQDGVRTGVVVVRQGQTVLHEGTLDVQARKLPDEALYKQLNGLSAS
ncbi:MAG: 6-phosphofructokinase [Anaerolineae bacterium]